MLAYRSYSAGARNYHKLSLYKHILSLSDISTTISKSKHIRTLPSSTVPLSHNNNRIARMSTISSSTHELDMYRRYGHYEALLDPLQLHIRSSRPELSSTIRNSTYDQLYGNQSYIGFEIDHLESLEERQFWYNLIENEKIFLQPLSYSDQRNIAITLTEGQLLEDFLNKKLPTLKRYSGEGCEMLLPAVSTIISSLLKYDVKELVIGQAHRGRLALLTSILKYPVRKLFWKLSGCNDIPDSVPGIDDVASHIYMSKEIMDFNNPQKKIKVSLLPNPSHLEAVNPVVLDKVRAKQDENIASCGLLIHGDAACSAQGVVAETYQLARLQGYSTQGTIHIITNNQLGFTSDYQSGRSSSYASDVGKIIHAPVLHINAERPQEIIHACRLAVQYRQLYHQDIIIDLIGYRKYGHNEVDEPSFTNPLMYKVIRQHESFAVRYSKEVLQTANYDKLVNKINTHLEQEYKIGTGKETLPNNTTKVFTPEGGSTGVGDKQLGSGTHVVADGTAYNDKWKHIIPKGYPINNTIDNNKLDTGLPIPLLQAIGKYSVQYPSSNFTIHDRLFRTHVTNRLDSLSSNTTTTKPTIDWSTAEALAFGSLLQEGKNIRFSGQDVQRGTFSHRHAVFVDQTNGTKYIPLNNMPKLDLPTKASSSTLGTLHIYSSLLSEAAVLSYEYGYSLENPHNLVLWEAQFGDFANCAQVVIDTFISSTESKWLRSSGLIMLLPHGYDGAGPEHSSSRIERFLQLVNDQAWASGRVHPSSFSSADKSVTESENLIIAQPTTAANYYHLLRRQLYRNYRKPLIIITPKALLRLPEAYSHLSDMGPNTHFQPVYDDEKYTSSSSSSTKDSVKRIILCSGKIYYELQKLRSTILTNKSSSSSSSSILTDVALIRIEELSPLPKSDIINIINSYSKHTELFWAQDEPSNMGAWLYIQQHLVPLYPKFMYIGRPALAAPAVGLSKLNKLQQDTLLMSVFQYVNK